MEYESTIRISVFLGLLVAMSGFEFMFPRKVRSQGRAARWFTNLVMIVSYSLVLRIVFPIVAVGVAASAHVKGWGALNLIDLPFWMEVVIAILVLDFAVYWQHVFSHKIPMFWALHKVHHADRDIDVTTGVRFHPIEIVLSMLYKMVWVVVLGPSVLAVVLFEILLNGAALFNHANVKLPLWGDRGLRMLVVTPDMHRVHHSVRPHETNSNYGFFLSIWDRVFGSYIAQPESGHEGMEIGLPQYQNEKPAHFFWCLLLPFRNKP